MSSKLDPMVTLSVRVPQSLLDRAENITYLRQSSSAQNLRVANTVRDALDIGLRAMESSTQSSP